LSRGAMAQALVSFPDGGFCQTIPLTRIMLLLQLLQEFVPVRRWQQKVLSAVSLVNGSGKQVSFRERRNSAAQGRSTDLRAQSMFLDRPVVDHAAEYEDFHRVKVIGRVFPATRAFVGQNLFFPARRFFGSSRH